MTGSLRKLQRIGSLDIAEAVIAVIGSYLVMNFVQFLAVEGSQVRCWYVTSDDDGPASKITLTFEVDGWLM